MGATVALTSLTLQVVEGEGRQTLGSGQPTGQRHSAKYSAFSTGNRISFPLLLRSDLYMEIASSSHSTMIITIILSKCLATFEIRQYIKRKYCII